MRNGVRQCLHEMICDLDAVIDTHNLVIVSKRSTETMKHVIFLEDVEEAARSVPEASSRILKRSPSNQQNQLDK